ncbi:MAG TPA: hypothetical protein V6D06_04345 [Trichocoleus sp.]
MRTIPQPNSNGRDNPESQNGNRDDLELQTEYEHLASDTWRKREGGKDFLTDSQAIRDELDEDEEDQSDDRN